LALASRIAGEIVNCDSMQTVRGLDIGTAKPTREERAQIPHHLFDLVEPGEVFSAGAYMEKARAACEEIAERGSLPIVVGGTGLYLRALLEGIFPGPGRSDRYRRRVRLLLARRGPEYLHQRLAARDPVAAARIQPRDALRVIRALEVLFLAGSPISSLQPQRDPIQGYQVVKLGLDPPRSDLYARIDARVEQIFKQGLLQEVHGLLAAGHSPESKGFEALGYRYAVQALQGSLSVAEAVQLTQRDTRRYAKRQLTWFRREPGVHWIRCAGDDPGALTQAEAVLRKEGIWPSTSR
jgi:tRNA dimethylallyltransferase